MRLASIKIGDIVHVDKRGRLFHAEVVEREGRELILLPIEPNISYRRCTSREVRDHWRKSRSKSQEDKES